MEYHLDWSLLLFARREIWVDYRRALGRFHPDMLVVSLYQTPLPKKLGFWA